MNDGIIIYMQLYERDGIFSHTVTGEKASSEVEDEAPEREIAVPNYSN